MIPLVVLLPAVVAAAALVYGVVRTRRSDRGRVMSWVSAADAAGSAPRPGGRHRCEDARTGSLSATAILQALDAQAGGL